LAITKCGTDSCLVVADIGDNKLQRDSVQFIALNEKQLAHEGKVKPILVVKAKYPDGPQNAEAAAFHPNGDLYVFTKEKIKKNDPMRTKIYRLRKTLFQSEGLNSKVHALEIVTELRVDSKDAKIQKKGKFITSADISSDGKKVIFLTQLFAFEAELDLSAISKKQTTIGLNPILLPVQPKQEAIAYSTGDKGFYFTSEQVKSGKKMKKSVGKFGTLAALVEVTCF